MSCVRKEVASTSSVPLFLLAWLAFGAIVLALLPAADGGSASGATLPFWLVGAPLIDLAWVCRARILRRMRSAAPRRRIGVAGFRNLRRAPRTRMRGPIRPYGASDVAGVHD